MMKRSLLSALFLLGSVLPLSAQTRADWMPEEATSAGSGVDGGERLLMDVTYTPLPKATADLEKYKKICVIDLKKYGIRNNGTEPEATSAGINAALQDAKKNGFDRIVFPAGIYLISEKDPVVLDHKNTVIDLNGAEFRINPNGLQGYAVFCIVQGAENLRLTNGTIRGDRDVHDYKTSKGPHEGGNALKVISGKNLELDHLTLLDATGSGLSTVSTGTRNRPELLKRIFFSVYPEKHLEQGAFDGQGNKIASAEKTRTSNMISMAKFEDEFEIGYLAGYQGFPFVRGRVYQIYFYDGEKKFIEKRKCLQYRKVKRPANAQYLNLEFNQPEVTDIPFHSGAAAKSWVLRINNFLPPTDVHFHHNVMRNNRGLGIGLCGGQRWILEHNLIEGNGPNPPGYGMDIEDGWELVQDVVFRHNIFRNNLAGEIVVCAGSELVFEHNLFEAGGKFPGYVIFYGRTYNYFFRNNTLKNCVVTFGTRTGIAAIHDNTYIDSRIRIRYDSKGVADGLYRKTAGEQLKTPALVLKNETLRNVSSVSGTYVIMENCKLEKVNVKAGKDTRALAFRNCTITDSGILSGDLKVEMKENNGSFSILEEVNRKGKIKK